MSNDFEIELQELEHEEEVRKAILSRASQYIVLQDISEESAIKIAEERHEEEEAAYLKGEAVEDEDVIYFPTLPDENLGEPNDTQMKQIYVIHQKLCEKEGL
ncbi:hypothetical protein [Acinetobacter rudis]|uniref:hypothetical protein n=1 Tax=Acinetobacter rudis TaxID=632955 RepID=UPI003340962C